MRVHFDNVNFGALTGPNTFAARLARSLFEAGHEVVDDGLVADVSLVFIEPSGSPLAKRIVQRLDGIWFRPQDFHAKNVNIKRSYETADAVIWQSEFDRSMTTKWWGQPCRGHVIRNGIDTTPVKEITIPALLQLRNDYDRIYVCSSNWHPQKRLQANVDLFNVVKKSHRSCLIIMGANPDVRVASPDVFYTGVLQPHEYMEVFAAADWMFHLAWADHCPNVVVEALSQGTPVVCSEIGGTKELIGKYGIVLKEAPYNFELYDYDKPPSINVAQVNELPNRTSLDHSTIADIKVENVVTRYIEVFKSLVTV